MISKDTPGSHQVYGFFLFSIRTFQVGDPKGRDWDLELASPMPCCVFSVLHSQGQAAPLPKNPKTPGNSPQPLKLSTFFTKPLAEGGVLDFWLVQAQSAGYKHTTQLSVRISRAHCSIWCPPGTRSGTDQGFQVPTWGFPAMSHLCHCAV